MNEKKTLCERRKKHLSVFFSFKMWEELSFFINSSNVQWLCCGSPFISPSCAKKRVCLPGSRRQIFKINFFHENSFPLVYNNKCCAVLWQRHVRLSQKATKVVHIILFFRWKFNVREPFLWDTHNMPYMMTIMDDERSIWMDIARKKNSEQRSQRTINLTFSTRQS